MEKVFEARLRRFFAKPLEFWPFQAGIDSDERAVRAARAAVYIGIGHAYQARTWRGGAWAFAAAAVLLVVFGRPGRIKLDDASLSSNPNPAGNPPVGDMSGRSPETPSTPASISMADFVGRMQEPIRTDDYAIIPVAPATQAHQIFGDTTYSSELATTRRPVPIPARS